MPARTKKVTIESESTHSSPPDYRFRLAALAVILFYLFSAYLRSGEPFGIDQGMFACFGRWTLEGWLPYRDLWDQKPPGLVHIYGLAFALFGRSVEAVWWLEGIWVAASCLLLYLLCSRLLDRWAGLFAALFLFLGFEAPRWGGYWSRAQGEVFLSLPLIGAAYAALAAREKPRAALWTGVLMGLVTMFKMPALALAALWPWVWLPGARWRGWLGRCVLFAAGILAPWLACLLYFWLRGGAGEMIESVFIFPFYLRRAVAGFMPMSRVIVEVIRSLAVAVPAACLAAVIGVGALIARRDRLALWLGPWVLIPVLAIIAQGLAAPYHFLLAIPGLAAGGGVGVSWLLRWWRQGAGAARWLAVTGIVAVVLLAGWQTRAWIGASSPDWAYITGRIDRPTYLEREKFSGFRPAVEAEMAAYVRRNTRPGDGILIWGSAPGIYFLADRHPCTRYAFSDAFLSNAPLSKSLPGLDERRKAFLARLERDPPALILVGLRDINAFERDPSYTQMKRFTRFDRFVREGYELADTTPYYAVYRRRAEQP